MKNFILHRVFAGIAEVDLDFIGGGPNPMGQVSVVRVNLPLYKLWTIVYNGQAVPDCPRPARDALYAKASA